MPSLPKVIATLLDDGPFSGKAAMAYRLSVTAVVLLATAVDVARTVPDVGFGRGPAGVILELAAQLVLTVDLLLRACHAVVTRPAGRGRGEALRTYLGSPAGVIDLLAALPYFVELAVPEAGDLDTILGVVRFLKLARFSPALETLWSVVRREGRPLQSAAFIMALLLLGTSTALYLAERHVNPHFISIPHTMWWSVATLTTVGYGDAVPVTAVGKLLGGLVALLGIAMFALPASILATGFAEEMRRRDFLTIWHMVAKVPFFAGLDAQEIAAITTLLRTYAAAPGEVLIRAGDIGDRMYFIVGGLVSADFGGAEPALLGDGDFFGEIALLNDSRRTATVRARSRCQLLVLDAKDFSRFLAGSPHVAVIIAETARRRLSQQVGAGLETAAPPA